MLLLLSAMFLSFSLLHILIHLLGRTFFGGVRYGSRPSFGIKVLLVSWLTLWWTHRPTHINAHPWLVLQLLVYLWIWFLADKVLAQGLFERPFNTRVTHKHTYTHSSLFLLLSRTFLYSSQLMNKGKPD